MSETKSVEEIYQKKTQLEHILLRPDTYIGSVEHVSQQMWVFDSQSGGIVQRDISYVPGFYKIFDEILVNAADNKIRDPVGMSVIRVELDKENGWVRVYNNGRGIPVQIHKSEGVYVPELIFGHLLTSSNYNDQERKVTGGRNGYGAKLCNIFSREFVVETADKASGLRYKQVFKSNMTVKGEPQVAQMTKSEEYTRISFRPDFEKFGMSCIDEDTESLLIKRVYDLAGCVRNVKVYLNGERIGVSGFRQYVDLYLKSRGDDPLTSRPFSVLHQVINDRWEIAFTVSDGQFQQASFVNSICTSKGGTHVSYVVDQIVTRLAESISRKNKAAPVKPFQIKNYIWIFVNCLVENPAFDSQTKENMTLKQASFGSKCLIDDDFITKVKKSGVVEHVLQWAQGKQTQMLKKTDGSKRSRLTGITKLDDANNAGTKNASRCTLILTEGDSAKTLAVTGLSVVGRDDYGVFPLRGKLLNVREASHKQIMENQEINYIKQILGLQHGKKYTDVSSLRYGHLMIMTDQDHDGSHIKGLIINFIDHFWPELLQIPGFLCQFITPIVKVTKGKNEHSFYTIPEYENWKKANNEGKGWTIKYYKGLGTSTKEDARKYFENIDFHRKEFDEIDDEDRLLIDMAFSKKKVENRKDWLRHYQPGIFMDNSSHNIHLSEFINKELILFSMADNIRSIPSVVDGLKPGLRKILYSCFKRNLVKDEVKVAQLVGYVAEHSAYHHGEQSLMSSIIGMAQNFVGSNNLNLLEPRGQFGSRLQGGKDAASPRYIFTRLSPLARKVFPKADDALLKYLNDDGQSIEPEWYMPIIPMVLVNGAEGIGTGWSSFIANYNPEDIVANLIALMDGEETKPMHPWYLGFAGEMVPYGNDKYLISGKIQKTGPTTLEITELPIRTWTQTCKEFLETLVTGTDKTPGFIKDYKEYHTDTTVHFVINLSEENMRIAEEEGLEKKFKLTTTLSLSNMVCFDEQGRIKKYNSVNDILTEFYQLRLRFYHARKEYLVGHLSDELAKLENKVRFVEEIIEGKLIVQNRKKVEIITTLKSRNYRPFGASVTPGDDDEVGGYDYLLSMPLWNLTYEKVDAMKKERNEKKAELDELLNKTSKDLWRADLEEFLAEWRQFVESIRQDETATKKSANSARSKKKPLTMKKSKKKEILNSDEDATIDDDDDDLFDDTDDEDFESKPKQKSGKSVSLKKPASQTAMKKPNISKMTSSTLSSALDEEEFLASKSTIPSSQASSIASLDVPKKRKDTVLSSSSDSSPSPKKTKSKIKPAASVKLGSKKMPVLIEDDTEDEAFKSKAPAPKQNRAATVSDDDFADDFGPSKPAKKSGALFSSELDDFEPKSALSSVADKKPAVKKVPIKKQVASSSASQATKKPAAATKPKKTAPVKSNKKDISEDDDDFAGEVDSDTEVVRASAKSAPAARAKRVAAQPSTSKIKYSFSSDEEKNDDDVFDEDSFAESDESEFSDD